MIQLCQLFNIGDPDIRPRNGDWFCWPPSTAASATTAPAATLAAVSVKLPPFWPSDSELWFAQVEDPLRLCRRLPQPRVRHRSQGPLLNPPEDHPYDMLKAQLIKCTATSAQHKLQQLISGEKLCDRKPSQLLRHMQQLRRYGRCYPFSTQTLSPTPPHELQDGPRVYRQFYGPPQARQTGRQ